MNFQQAGKWVAINQLHKVITMAVAASRVFVLPIIYIMLKGTLNTEQASPNPTNNELLKSQ
jgi:hypothetical protein